MNRFAAVVLAPVLLNCGGDDPLVCADGYVANDAGECVELLPPTDACESLMACARATDDSDLELYEASYGEGGTCWVDSTTALACDSECSDRLEDASQQHPTESDCWVNEQPDAALIFPEPVTWIWTVTAVGPCDFDDISARFSSDGDDAVFQATLRWTYVPADNDSEAGSADCTFDGRKFECTPAYSGWISSGVMLQGEFADGFQSAEGAISTGTGFDACAVDGAPE